MIFGILPNDRITRNHQGADSAKSVFSCTSKLKGDPAKKKTRKSDDNDVVALLKNSRQFGLCIPRCRAAEIKFDLVQGHKSLETNSQSEVLEKHASSHRMSGKEGCIALCDSMHHSS